MRVVLAGALLVFAYNLWSRIRNGGARGVVTHESAFENPRDDPFLRYELDAHAALHAQEHRVGTDASFTADTPGSDYEERHGTGGDLDMPGAGGRDFGGNDCSGSEFGESACDDASSGGSDGGSPD